MTTLMANPSSGSLNDSKHHIATDLHAEDDWKEWKAKLWREIDMQTNVILDEARKRRDAKLKASVVTEDERKKLAEEFNAESQSIRDMAQATLKMEIAKEMELRSWASGYAVSSPELLREQQSIFDNIKKTTAGLNDSERRGSQNNDDASSAKPGSSISESSPLGAPTHTRAPHSSNYAPSSSRRDLDSSNTNTTISDPFRRSSSGVNPRCTPEIVSDSEDMESPLLKPPSRREATSRPRPVEQSDRPLPEKPTMSSSPRVLPEFWVPPILSDPRSLGSTVPTIGYVSSGARRDLDPSHTPSSMSDPRQSSRTARYAQEIVDDPEDIVLAPPGKAASRARQIERPERPLPERPFASSSPKERPEIWKPSVTPQEDQLASTPYAIGRRGSTASIRSTASNTLHRSTPAPVPIPEASRLDVDEVQKRAEQERIKTEEAERAWQNYRNESKRLEQQAELRQSSTASEQAARREEQPSPVSASSSYRDNQSHLSQRHILVPQRSFTVDDQTRLPLGRQGSFTGSTTPISPGFKPADNQSRPSHPAPFARRSDESPASSNTSMPIPTSARTLDNVDTLYPNITPSIPIAVPQRSATVDVPHASPEWKSWASLPHTTRRTEAHLDPNLRSSASRNFVGYDLPPINRHRVTEEESDESSDEYDDYEYDEEVERKRQEEDAARKKQEELERKERDAKQREEEIEAKNKEAERKELEVRQKEEEIKRKQAEALEKEKEIQRKQEEALQKELETLEREQELRKKDAEARLREEEIKNREEAVKKREEDLNRRDALVKEEEEIRARGEALRKREEEVRIREAEARRREQDKAKAQQAKAMEEKQKEDEKQRMQQEDFRKREEEIRRRAEERKRQDSLGTDGSGSSSTSPNSFNTSWSTRSGGSSTSASSGSDWNSTSSSSRSSASSSGWSSASRSNTTPTSHTSASSTRPPPTTPTSGPKTRSNTGTNPSPATSQASTPLSEAEWARRQAEQAKKQQEQFRREQERMENERQAKAGRLLTKEDIAQLFETHDRQWSRLSTLEHLSWEAFPWPMLKKPTDPEEITTFAISAYVLSPHHPDKTKSEKDRIKEHIRRWHPDRFETKLLPKVVEADREKVKSGAGSVVRSLNDLLTKSNAPSIFS